MLFFMMLLKPVQQVVRVDELNPAKLRAYGVRAVCVDLDDTLIAQKSNVLAPYVQPWIDTLIAAGIPVIILSNGTPKRVKAFAKTLNLPGYFLVGKPWPWAFWLGCKRLGYAPAELAMVGDQLFTDVLGANMVGAKAFLVRPLSPGRWHTRLLRGLEQYVLRHYNLR